MTEAKLAKLVIALGICVVIAAGVWLVPLVRNALWDKEYLATIDIKDNRKKVVELERLLQSASPDRKPWVQYQISGILFLLHDRAACKTSLEKTVEDYKQTGDEGGQINALGMESSLEIVGKQFAAAEQHSQQALDLLGESDSKNTRGIPNVLLDFLRIHVPLPSKSKTSVLCDLALAKEGLGKVDDAEKLYKKALFSQNAFDRAMAAELYSGFLKKHNRAAEANKILATAEDSIKTPRDGKNHEFDSNGLAISVLASHQEAQGNFAEALRLYKKREQIAADQNGIHSNEHIESLVDVGKTLKTMGKEQEAERVFKQAYQLAKEPQSESEKSLHRLRLQNWCIINAGCALGDFYFGKKDYTKAEALYKEAVDQHSDGPANKLVSLSRRPPTYSWDQLKVADCYLEERKFTDAEAIYKSALAALAEDSEIGHHIRYQLYHGYSRCLKALGNTKESEDFAARAEKEKAKFDEIF